jgi:hypothetical protein
MDEEQQKPLERSIVAVCLACDAVDTDPANLSGSLGMTCTICRSEDVRMAVAVSCAAGPTCSHARHHEGLDADLALLDASW